MPSHPDSSFAYRASRFVLMNRHLIYCHCAKPDLVYSAPARGACGQVPFCASCKGLLDNERIEDMQAITEHNAR